MFRWADVMIVPYVTGPLIQIGIHRAANHEFTIGQAARRSKEHLLERSLPVFGVSSQIGEIGLIPMRGFHPVMNRRVYPPIERRNILRLESLAQQFERLAARIAKH